jgi:hypothetical protein
LPLGELSSKSRSGKHREKTVFGGHAWFHRVGGAESTGKKTVCQGMERRGEPHRKKMLVVDHCHPYGPWEPIFLERLLLRPLEGFNPLGQSILFQASYL